MLESALTAAGSGLGAGLGQVSDLLSAPRKATWNLAAQLGQMAGIGDGTAYDSGADLLAGTLGMDPNSMLTQGLGMGAEMLLDPMSYVGGLLGKLGGMGVTAARGAKAASAADKAGEAATVASRLEKLAGPTSAPGIAMREATVASQGDRMGRQINAVLNKPGDITPYLESAMTSGADDSSRLSRRLAEVGTAPGGVAPKAEMASAKSPLSTRTAINPRKAAANERYLADKAGRIDNLEETLSQLGDPLSSAAPATGNFSGPFTPQIQGAPSLDALDIYGPALTTALLGGGAGAAYMMGQNR